MLRLATVSAQTFLRRLAARWPAFAGREPPDRSALQGVVDAHGAAWHLVEPTAREGYEASIARGRIPTRDGSWHDAFNVLAFVTWPAAKAALHARVLQCQDERRPTGRTQRGREEDALAIIDETVVVFSGAAEVLTRFDAARAIGCMDTMHAVVGEGLRVRWFGHALLEHLALGRPPIDAGVWTIAVLPDERDDEAFARQIAARMFATPRFAPNVPWPDARVLAWVDV